MVLLRDSVLTDSVCAKRSENRPPPCRKCAQTDAMREWSGRGIGLRVEYVARVGGEEERLGRVVSYWSSVGDPVRHTVVLGCPSDDWRGASIGRVVPVWER